MHTYSGKYVLENNLYLIPVLRGFLENEAIGIQQLFHFN